MKQLFTLLTSMVCAAIINAQTISPDINQEYCPNTNYNFVVSVPGTITSITPSGGCSVVGQLANALTGRFNDANVQQTFTVTYTARANAL